MRASYQPRRASSRRLESPFSWGFLGVLLLALELLLPMCSASIAHHLVKDLAQSLKISLRTFHLFCTSCLLPGHNPWLVEKKLLYFHVLILSCPGACGEPPKYKTMRPKYDLIPPIGEWFAVEYICNQGYKPLVPPVQPTATSCQPDGSYHPPLQEACTAYCPQLKEPPNGKLVSQNGTYNFGAHVQYVCTEGYYVLGPDVLVCQDSGGNNLAWSEAPPSCEKIVCQPPPQISDGKFTNDKKDTYEYNDTVIYSCMPPDGPDGYTLIGESKLVCIGYYQWSSHAPECK
ncbi:hypothetical protein QTO34_011534, partial [Cnephaeus nilssonii]